MISAYVMFSVCVCLWLRMVVHRYEMFFYHNACILNKTLLCGMMT